MASAASPAASISWVLGALNDEDLIRIIDMLVVQVNMNLTPKQLSIRLTPEAAKYILEKTCTDRSYGARPLRRALQKYIEDPLSEALIQGSLPRPADLDQLHVRQGTRKAPSLVV